MDKSWNPWKVTALVLALVMATALVTGLVVANWSGSSPESEPRIAAGTRPAQPARATTVKPSTLQVVPAGAGAPAGPEQGGGGCRKRGGPNAKRGEKKKKGGGEGDAGGGRGG